jgi:hypothetical protein
LKVKAHRQGWRNPNTRRPIKVETLQKHFADELESGSAEMDRRNKTIRRLSR